MEEEPLPQQEAGERFVGLLIQHCYEGMIPEVMQALQNGPPGGKPPTSDVRKSQWFRSLNAADRAQVQSVVGYSHELCLFHLLNILDGTSPVEVLEQASDFAVYLQTYTSDEDMHQNNPETTVRVNPVIPNYENGGEQLHDIFSEIMAERFDE